MPDFCAAYGCSNERSLQTRALLFLPFLRFPKSGELRRQWELALKRDDFVVNNRSLVCSDHFHKEDFDRTGQTVRLKAGAVPKIFNFPAHLQRVCLSLAHKNSRHKTYFFLIHNPIINIYIFLLLLLCSYVFQNQKAATEETQMTRKRESCDHLYALPSCPKALKSKLDAASQMVRKLQREKGNAMARERRAKKNMRALLEELKDKNLINEELKDKLECYSGKINNYIKYIFFFWVQIWQCHSDA
uniref:THAP-type domain-containing protein n=1 Tax=Salarias fasciatus TaxID=181472 RepID=A0A672H2L9_SALFA